jgi:hypothetical protein
MHYNAQMRTVLFGNYRLAAEVGRYLMTRQDLAGVVLPPAGIQQSAGPLRDLGVPVWEWPGGFSEIKAMDAAILLSVLFEVRLPPEWLALASWHPLNLHLGYLPYNRGRAPHLWPLIDGSPAGVSLHVMDDGVDAGGIVCQERAAVHDDDTGGSLLARLEAAALAMLRDSWPRIGTAEPVPQPAGGSRHTRGDLEALALTPADLAVVDKLRALSGPGRGTGAAFSRSGQRYLARISIEPDR